WLHGHAHTRLHRHAGLHGHRHTRLHGHRLGRFRPQLMGCSGDTFALCPFLHHALLWPSEAPPYSNHAAGRKEELEARVGDTERTLTYTTSIKRMYREPTPLAESIWA